MGVKDVAEAVGKGLFAGAIGTAAMTASSTLEMKLQNRTGSSAPAAAAKVLGVKPVDEQAEARFANIVHWGYGIGWGSVRGLLGVAGLSGPAATVAHFATVWGSEQVMLPALDVAPPITEWGRSRSPWTRSTTQYMRSRRGSLTRRWTGKISKLRLGKD